MPRFSDLHLGPLPVDLVNRVLGYELEKGDVIFRAAAQHHAWRHHKNEYAQNLQYLSTVVTTPTYMGDDYKNPGKIALVSRIPGAANGLLAAVIVEPMDQVNYGVASMYQIDQQDIDRRRQKGHLKNAPLKI